MFKLYTTEITSAEISSDNPIHQRLYKAYIAVTSYIKGNVLEIGCGEGRGIDLILPLASEFTAVDKIESALVKLKRKYPNALFISMNIPPLSALPDNTYNTIISFQVIEHIQNDKLFIKEIQRVLKPGGVAIITTPNRKMSLTRNPWHVREYTATELVQLAQPYFSSVEIKGINGNDIVMEYYNKNKESVERITRWDVLKLQYRLPASILRIPYELLNRWNRNKLQKQGSALVKNITHNDYIVTHATDESLDLLLLCKK